MIKQKKKSGSDIAAPQTFNSVVDKKTFTSPGNSDKEMDADELIHQKRDEEPEDAAFDVDEAVHKINRNTNREPGRMTDIDDLVHENAGEDDEPIY
jgi:hypothetical protein